MRFKITIILPIFNVENYVEKALNSIINQTIGVENLEVIMVDDCSTDRSGEIINEYADNYENFEAIHLSKNSGAPGEGKNIGIKKASSDYIMFLDPDDFYEKDACEILYKKIKETGADFVSGTYKINNNGKKSTVNLNNIFKNQKQIEINSLDDFPEILYTGPVMLSKIFNKKFILDNNISFPPHIPAEDNVFFLNSIFNAKKVIFIKKPIFTYFKRKTSMTQDISIKSLTNFLKAQKIVFNTFKENNKEKYYDYYYITKLDHYLNYIFLIKNIEVENIEHIYEEMKWFLEIAISMHIVPKNYFNQLLFEFLLKKEFNNVLVLKKLFDNQKSKFKKLESEIKDLKRSENSLNEKIAILKTNKGWFKYKIKKLYSDVKLKLRKK